MMQRPKYYDMTISDYVPMSDMVGEPDHLRSLLNQRCGYQRIGQGCNFCTVESRWAGFMDKTLAHVAEVAAAAYAEALPIHERYR
jgi:hypothetical protein